jgi:hypothetical protein
MVRRNAATKGSAMTIELGKFCASRGELDGRCGGKSREELEAIVKSVTARDSVDSRSDGSIGLEKSLMFLDDAVAGLKEELTQLSKDLGPVCVALNPNVARAVRSDAYDVAAVSPAVLKVLTTTSNLNDLRQYVNDLIDRLRL